MKPNTFLAIAGGLGYDCLASSTSCSSLAIWYRAYHSIYGNGSPPWTEIAYLSRRSRGGYFPVKGASE